MDIVLPPERVALRRPATWRAERRPEDGDDGILRARPDEAVRTSTSGGFYSAWAGNSGMGPNRDEMNRRRFLFSSGGEKRGR